MTGSKFMVTLTALVFLGATLLAISACSSDDASFAPPDGSNAQSGFPSAPAAPTGFTIEKANERGFSLIWDANAETDLAGYRVSVYDPSPFRAQSYRCPHGVSLLPCSKTRYVYNEQTTPGTYYFIVVAVDNLGNTSEPAGPFRLVYDGSGNDRGVDDREMGGEIDGLPGDPWQGGDRPGGEECDAWK